MTVAVGAHLPASWLGSLRGEVVGDAPVEFPGGALRAALARSRRVRTALGSRVAVMHSCVGIIFDDLFVANSVVDSSLLGDDVV